MKNIKCLLNNRLILSAIISIIIWLVLLFNCHRFKSDIISTQESTKDYSVYYSDLDGDGNSEELGFIRNYNNMLGLVVFSKNKTIGQWNFMGNIANSVSPGQWNSIVTMPNFVSPIISDFDNDGIKEIIFFTISRDSIYIHCLDAINQKIEFNNKAICKVYKDKGGVCDYTIIPCSAYDANADGYQEVFFAIRSGFTKYPRNLFAYYPITDSVYVSPESCSLVLNPGMFDMDGDTIPEFYSSLTHATGNCDFDRKFTDQFSWLMVFTPELKFKFPPVSFNKHPSISRFVPYSVGDKCYIFCLHVYQGIENVPSYLALFDTKGKLIRQKEIDNPQDWIYSPVVSGDENYQNIYILHSSGKVMRIDSLLNMCKVANIKNNNNSIIAVYKNDIDCDGKKEFIIPGMNKGELIIYRNDFSNPVKIELNNDVVPGQISIIEKIGELPTIFIESADNLYVIAYETTLIYKFRYFLVLLIFLVVVLNYSLAQQIQKYRKLKIDNIQRQISELQVKSIQNQLDPHFTFNIFASFGNLINEKDTETANYIFDKYAGLLKACVINSEKIQISLKEELDFVESYLELEKFRYNGKFSFLINMEDSVDKQALIPKMIIHIFVENAIKHGLKHLNSGGNLEIHGWIKDGAIFIDITDNGIGRAKAKELGNFSTGKGMEIMDKIIDYYNKLNNCKIKYRIIDLAENSIAKGTQVNIAIPLRH